MNSIPRSTHEQAPLQDEQTLVVRPVASLHRNANEEWAVSVGARRRVLRGQSADLVLPELPALLDGNRDVGRVVERLGALCGVSQEVARGCLERLYHWEILDDAAGYRPPGQPGNNAEEEAHERFFALFSSRPLFNAETLGNTRVAVAAADPGAEALRSRLVSTGLRAAAHTPGREADLVVSWGHSRFSPELDALNRACVASATPLLVAGAGPTAGDLGPLVMPRQSACVACVRDHFGAATSGWNKAVASGPLFAAESVAMHLVALEVLRFAAPCMRPSTVGVLRRYDAAAQQLVATQVLRRPRCSVCGQLTHHSPAIAFQERGVRADGR